MINITLSGIPPAKKNSKKTIYRGGKKYVVPSDSHAAWHAGATSELWAYKKILPKKPLRVVTLIEIAYYTPDKKKRDGDNCDTSVLDFLVDMQIIEDDCFEVVRERRSKYCGIDANNPRTEITIYAMC